MKYVKYNFWLVILVFTASISTKQANCQWVLADTTIQSARDVDFPHPNAAYLTSDMGLLFKSTDGGVSWVQQYDFGVFSSLRTPRFINKDTGFVSANYGIQRTYDGGQTWTSVATGSFYTPSSFSVSPSALVISYFNNDTMYVKRSINYGLSFNTILKRYNPNFTSFAVSFINLAIGFVINPDELNTIYKTVNAGSSFDTIQIANGPITLGEKFSFRDDQTNGFLYGDMWGQSNASRTWTGGATFFSLDFDGFGVLPVLDIEFLGANKIIGSSLYGKIYTSLNNGQFWLEHSTPVNNEVTSVSFADDMNGIAISRDKIIYTKNGGALSNQDYGNTKIKIYPNPTKDWLFIDNEFENIEMLVLYNLKGQLLKEFSGGKKKINLDNFKSGTYLLKIETGSGTITKKIILK